MQQIEKVRTLRQGGLDCINGALQALQGEAAAAEGAHQAGFAQRDDHFLGGNGVSHAAGVAGSFHLIGFAKTPVSEIFKRKRRQPASQVGKFSVKRLNIPGICQPNPAIYQYRVERLGELQQLAAQIRG